MSLVRTVLSSISLGRAFKWPYSALGDEMSAQATLERLMREGLDRHEAIHAIGSVLVEFLQELVDDDAPQQVNESYNEELKKLTAAEWLKTYQ